MSLPQTMTAIEIAGFGPPDVLKPTTRPVPAPGAGEVLIRVAAAGVNRPDVQQRLGLLALDAPPGSHADRQLLRHAVLALRRVVDPGLRG